MVEGKDDTANLRRFYEVDTYETRGSAINEDDLERIDKLNELRGVIVFTDPDYNGERIRKIIMEAVPTAKHAFLNRGEATPKSKTKGRSLGVEHASFEDLQKALSGVLGSYDDDNQFDISKSNLMKLGLLMGAESKASRIFGGGTSYWLLQWKAASKTFGIVWNYSRGARRGYVKLLDYQ